MEFLRYLITLLVATASDRNRLAIENTVLRQQILVLQRGVTRARLEDSDRMLWIMLRRFVRAKGVRCEPATPTAGVSYLR